MFDPFGFARPSAPRVSQQKLDGFALQSAVSVRQYSSLVEVFAAFEGQVVEIAASPKGIARRSEELQAETTVEPVPIPRAVLLGVAGTATSAAVCKGTSSREHLQPVVLEHGPLARQWLFQLVRRDGCGGVPLWLF